MKYVYIFKIGDYYKIGFTSNLRRRAFSFSYIPFDIQIVCIIQTDEPRKTEKEVHDMFANKNKTGEWFNLDHGDFSKIRRTYNCIIGEGKIQKHIAEIKEKQLQERKSKATINPDDEYIERKVTPGICPVCDKTFQLHRSDAIYCSGRCKLRAFRRKRAAG